MFAPALPYLAAAALPAAGALGGSIGRGIGGLIEGGIKKARKKHGFKKGGSFAPKQALKALNNATIKKTGMRLVKKNQLVIPKGVANTIKKIARRKPQLVRRKRK